MVYVRGGKEGFDQWAEEGCVGWDYKSVKPYFERVESKLNILHAEKNDFIISLINSCGEFGIPYNPDYNQSGSQLGIASFQFLIDKQMQRETSFRNYIASTNYDNLTIRTDVLVSRILFDEVNNCRGVEFYDMQVQPRTVQQMYIKNEVILCAGSIGTPRLLMLSGIGPLEHLESLGISVISNSPGVGDNLQDDIYVTAAFLSKQPVDPQPYGLLGAVIFAPSTMDSGTTLSAIGTDIQVSMASGEMVGMDLPPDQQRSYWLYPNIQRLNSRGTIKLQSNSIFDMPLIDPNYFADDKDIERSIEALQLAIDIGRGKGMANWFDRLLYPQNGTSPEALREYILKYAYTCYHYAGTAKMGPAVDRSSVVSPDTLSVYGVQGLRVVDASIIPRTVSGNTQAATLMIGEKGSDIILRTVGEKKLVKGSSKL